MIKERFYGTQEGFNLCLDFTTLYTPISFLCKNCLFKESCKDILKKTLPEIYEKRTQIQD